MLPGQHHGGVVISKSLEKKKWDFGRFKGGLDHLHVHVILGCGNGQIKIPSIVVELIDWGGTRKAWDIISSLDALRSQGVKTGRTLQQRPFCWNVDSFFVCLTLKV